MTKTSNQPKLMKFTYTPHAKVRMNKSTVEYLIELARLYPPETEMDKHLVELHLPFWLECTSRPSHDGSDNTVMIDSPELRYVCNLLSNESKLPKELNANLWPVFEEIRSALYLEHNRLNP